MENNVRYLLLTDEKNNGDVVKQEGTKFYSFVDSQWKRRGLSLGYFLPGEPEYECFRELSEDEAMKIVKAS